MTFSSNICDFWLVELIQAIEDKQVDQLFDLALGNPIFKIDISLYKNRVS